MEKNLKESELLHQEGGTLLGEGRFTWGEKIGGGHSAERKM